MAIFKTTKKKFLPKKPVEILFQAIGNESFPLGPNSTCYIAKNRPGNRVAEITATHPYMHITARKSMLWIWDQKDFTNQLVPKGKYIASIRKPIAKTVQFEISRNALQGLKSWAKRNSKYAKGAVVFSPLFFEPMTVTTLGIIAWGSDLISDDPPNFECETGTYIPHFSENVWRNLSMDQIGANFFDLLRTAFEAMTISVEKAQGALLLKDKQALTERKRDIQVAAETLEGITHFVVYLIKYDMERNFEKYSGVRLVENFERDQLHLFFADTLLNFDATLADYLMELCRQFASISYSANLLKRHIPDNDIREMIPDIYK